MNDINNNDYFFFSIETLRLYPPIPVLNRKPIEDYKVPGTNITLDKGTEVVLLSCGAHRDPFYYPNPDKFDPERWSDDAKNDTQFLKRPFFPFGDGPRNCIGQKLGKLQTKISLAMLLEKYFIEINADLMNSKKAFAPATIFSVPVGGIDVRVEKRN